jgi:DnaJ-class molecular chaperone
MKQKLEKCPRCFAYGKVTPLWGGWENRYVCPKCHGAGFVRKEEKQETSDAK